MKDKVIVAELNIDQNPFIKEKYQIQRYPTVLIFDRGIEVKRLVGAQSKSDLIDALEAAVFANVGMAGEEKY
jgi:thioredoxin-like negative regulator of GroEL